MTTMDAHIAKTRASRGVLVLLAVVAVGVISSLFWTVDAPPLIDWSNHLARHAIQCLADPMTGAGRFYEYELVLKPNIASELIHATPLGCADIFLTQKVLIQVATFGLFLSVIALHRAIWNRWSVWPLLSALVIHHMSFAYGFENYVITLPLVILAIALWVRMAGSSALLRFGVMLPVAGVLYACHLYAFGFLMVAIGLFELERWWRERSESLLTVLAGLLFVAAPFGAHLVITTLASPEITSGDTAFGVFTERLIALVSPGVPLISPDARVIGWLVIFAMIFAPLVLWRIGAGVQVARDMRLSLPLLAVLSLMLPLVLGGVYFTHIRWPILGLCVAIAAIDVRMSRRMAVVFAAAVVALLAAKSAFVLDRWRAHDAEVTELVAAFRTLSPDASVLAARQDMSETVVRHSHSIAYGSIEVGFYTPWLFTGGNALEPREAYAAIDVTQPFPPDWYQLANHLASGTPPEGARAPESWPGVFSHVVVFRDPATEAWEVPENATRVVGGSFFDLYAIEEG